MTTKLDGVSSSPIKSGTSQDFEYSNHALDMLRERQVAEEWVALAIDAPDYTEIDEDNNVHHIKSAPEFGERILRVVGNPHRTELLHCSLTGD